MHTMSAQTVLDSVNKYRHGVLIGNFVQDQFGKDLALRGPNPDAPKLSSTKAFHDIDHSLYKRHQLINNAQPVNKTFYKTAKEKADQDYIRPQKLTSYQTFYQSQFPNKLLGLQNNTKKQQYLNQHHKLYENTKYILSNKFGSKDNGFNQTLNEQIPDILTGQIMKTKKQPSDDNQNKNLKTKLSPEDIKVKSVNPYSTYSIIKPQIKSFQEIQYQNLVMPNQKGQKRDVLFGHGIALQDFHKRQLATTYDLSYNQRVKPQTQVNSFYQPGLSQTSQHFHRNTIYEKNHQVNIPPYGTKEIFSEPKVQRPYQPYTGSLDQNHLKKQFLRK